MDFLMSIWSFFATNILTQPAYFIGLMVLVGYLLLKNRYMKHSQALSRQPSGI